MFQDTDIIFSYTRAEAIADGYQTPLDNESAIMARQLYKHPVYLTSGVFNLIQQAVDHPKWCNDFKGVLWDILWMSQKASTPLNERSQIFQVIITGTGRKRYHKMIIECGPVDFDDPRPCLTIMLPEEN